MDFCNTHFYNDVCAGKVLIKCVLQKSTYNTTCPDECKDGKCIAKQVTDEEFVFEDLFVGKTLGSRKQVLMDNDLVALKTTKVNTVNGVTDVKYMLKFGGDNDDAIESGKVVYEKNRENTVGDYLKFLQSDDLFEYYIDFSRGLESSIGTNNKLYDLVGVQIMFFGVPYQIVDASTDATKKAIALKFMRVNEMPLLKEDESQTYTHNGKEYVVEVGILDTEGKKVRLVINGKTTGDLKIGDIFSTTDGFSISVKSIFTDNTKSASRNLVELFVGSDPFEFVDNDATNSLFERNVKVAGANLDRGRVIIRANQRTNAMKIDLIKYRADAKGSDNDIFLEKAQSLRKNSLEPESLLVKDWDLTYDGFASIKTEFIDFKHRNGRSYDLSFVNTLGKKYTVPLMDSTNLLKFGDDDQNLIFVENSAGNIERDDYFVLTDGNNANAVSYIYQLLSIDTSGNRVQIKDLAGSTKEASYTVDSNGLGTGTFSISGKTYTFVLPANGTTMGFDLNGNNAVGSDRVLIVAYGGLMINLGNAQDISGETSHTVTLTTPASKFKEGSNDESITMSITKGSEINMVLSDQTSLHLESSGSDTVKGMTSYGALYKLTGSTLKDLSIENPNEQRLASTTLSISKS